MLLWKVHRHHQSMASLIPRRLLAARFVAGHRSLSTVRHEKYMNEELGARVWLSDPGVYPLMGIIGAASTLCLAFFGWNLKNNPEIQLQKDKRRSTLRWWH